MQTISTQQTTVQKIMSICLALLLLIPIQLSTIASTAREAFADEAIQSQNADGWSFSLSWAKNDDLQNLNWESNTEETKVVRLAVNYNNESVQTGYQPGELTITVPGIGGAHRGSVIAAADIAADRDNIRDKKYDWSYTYNKDTDTYTFTNNKIIQAKENFSGSFEILWSLASRDTINGYNKTVKAHLSGTNGLELDSNTISFSYKANKDTYSVTTKASALGSTDGLGSDYKDYTWVKYTYNSSRQLKSNGLKDIQYEISLPEGVKIADIRTQSNSTLTYTYDKGVLTIPMKNNLSYWYSTNQPVVVVGYPTSKYANTTQEMSVKLVGTYVDSEQKEAVATTSYQTVLNPEDYDFNYSGSMYGISKTKNYNSQILYSKLFDGTGALTTYTNVSVRVSPDSNTSIEVLEDFQDILLNDNSMRQLAEDEYAYTSYTIPGTSSIRNGNNQPIQSDVYGYKVEAYSNGSWSVVQQGVLGANSRTITMPANTTKIKTTFSGLNETFNTSSMTANISYKVKADEDNTAQSAISPNGSITFNAALIVKDKEGHTLNSVDRDGYTGSNASGVADRDMAQYGTYMQRGSTSIPVTENELWRGYTELSNSNYKGSNNGYSAEITLQSRTNQPSGAPEAKRVTQHTILPKGVTVDEDELELRYSFSSLAFKDGSRVTATEVSEHATVDVTPNYKGSGRTYIGITYDFSDNPIVMSSTSSLGATIPVGINNEAYLEFGDSYRYQAVTIYEDASENQTNYYSTYYDNGSYASNEQDLWSDINQNGSTNELVSYANLPTTITLARATFQSARELVISDHTNGTYTDNSYVNVDDEYSWRMSFTTGTTLARDLVLYNNISEGGEWQGTFKGVDTTYLENKGFKPVVYYSNTTGSTDIADGNWSKASEWTGDLSSVKAIAVSLPDQTVEAGSLAYALVKMQAPNNKAMFGKETINSFTASFDSIDQVTGVSLGTVAIASQEAKVRLLDQVSTLTITKTDAVNGRRLANTYFNLYKSDGTLYREDIKTNVTGQVKLKEIEYGDYYLEEVKAPDGYKISDKNKHLAFTVNSDKTFVSMQDERNTGTIELIKTDAQTGLPVEGAVFELFSVENNVETSIGTYTTPASGKLTISDIAWGKYRIKEKSNTGYIVNDETYEVTISAVNAKGSLVPVLVGPKTGITNKQITSQIEITKYEKSDEGTLTTTPVDGATYALYNADDEMIEGNRLTSIDGKVAFSNIPFGDYYVQETVPAKGYDLNNEKMEFSFNRDNAGQTLTATTGDTRHKGQLSVVKIDESTNQRLAGVEFALYQTDGTLINNLVTNDQGSVNVFDLAWGDYYVQETKALDGFELDTAKHEFTIDRNNAETGVNLILANKHKSGSVSLTKVDADNHDLKLENAVYNLYKADGTLVQENLTTNAEGKLSASDLEWGAYYFLEQQAPQGYSVSSEKIRFTINATSAGTTQELIAEDKAGENSVTITKSIDESSVWWEHGNPTFIFKIAGSDNKTLYKTVTFDKDMTATDGKYIQSITVDGLRPNTQYEVSELSSIRYENTSTSKTVAFDTSTGESNYTAVFENTKINQEGLSDVNNVVNIVKSSNKLTSIAAEWSGGVLTDSDIDKTKLKVVANYDDGSSKVLNDTDYTITPEKLPSGIKGVYTITIAYTDRGATAQTTVELELDIPKKLADYSAAELQVIADDLAANGEASEYWDEFNAYMDNNEPWYYTVNNGYGFVQTFRIIGINHDNKSWAKEGDVQKAGITMEATNVISTGAQMNDSAAPLDGGWANSTLRNDLNVKGGKFYSYYESLMPYLATVDKTSCDSFFDRDGNQKAPTSPDKIFILSFNELFGPNIGMDDGSTIYEFYQSHMNDHDIYLKDNYGQNQSYWIRTICDDGTKQYYYYINADGYNGNQLVTNNCSFAPAICFGTSYEEPRPDFYINDSGTIIGPEEIKNASDDIAKNGEASVYWGQYASYMNDEVWATINWGDGNQYHARIIGINHDNKSDGSKAGLTFQFVELLEKDYRLNSSDEYEGIWSTTELYTKMNNEDGEIWVQAPNDLTSIIVPVEKYAHVGHMSGTDVSGPSLDKLWLISYSELTGATTKGAEGTQYEYYSNLGLSETANDLYKRYKPGSTSAENWWERSSETYYDIYGYYVDSEYGQPGGTTTGVNNAIGVLPCFSVGSEPERGFYIKDGNKIIGPEEIQIAADEISKYGESSSYYNQYKNYMDNDVQAIINWGDGQQYHARIIGINHDNKADGSKAGLTFQFVELLKYKYSMNSTQSNQGGWVASELRGKMNNDDGAIWTQAPKDLSNVIVPVEKYARTGGNQSGVTTKSGYDKLWLASYSELTGTTSTSYKDEGTQYEYFSNLGLSTSTNSKFARYQPDSTSAGYWWTRTASASNSLKFAYMSPSGGINSTGQTAYMSYCVLPCFSVGSEPESQFYFEDNGEKVTSAQIKAAAEDIATYGSSSIYYEQYKGYMDNDTQAVVNWGDGKQYHARIIGINHDNKADGSKAGLTFQFVELLNQSHRMNATSTNEGGWAASELRGKMNNDDGAIWTQAPWDMKKDIAEVEKYARTGGNQAGVTIEPNNDKLWLASYSELTGSTSTSYKDEGTQYEYYSNLGLTTAYNELYNRYKPGSTSAYIWWERSAFSYNAANFYNVNSGNPDYSVSASYTYGVLPCFCY